jgi:hypothetical protein
VLCGLVQCHLLVEGGSGGIRWNEKLALPILVSDRHGAKHPVRTNARRRDAIDRFGDGVEAVNAHLVPEQPPAEVLAPLHANVDNDEGLMQQAPADDPASKWNLVVVI